MTVKRWPMRLPNDELLVPLPHSRGQYKHPGWSNKEHCPHCGWKLLNDEPGQAHSPKGYTHICYDCLNEYQCPAEMVGKKGDG